MAKIQAELLSCLAYTDKKTNQPKTRLGYRLLESKYRQDTNNLKGFSELSTYVDGHVLFNNMKPEYFGVQAEIEIEERPSSSNPLRNVQVIKSIKVGENVISVL